MWNFGNSSIPSRKLVKARKSREKQLMPSGIDCKLDDQPPPEIKVIDEFESDIAWDAAWDNRKKVRIFYCSRVLRKLRRKCRNSTSSWKGNVL